MPEQNLSPDGASNEANKTNLDDSNTATVHLELDESKAHLINANGGAGGDHDELKTEIIDPTSASSDGEISFSGLGKEEVMRYANDPFWVRLRWILFILFWVGWLAMLVTAIVIIVLAPRCPPRPDLKWYQTDTVYQVLPKSFKDSNGDGIGDFEGLTSKLSYITDLGVKAIWINNIYLTDSNSGVLDHKDISPSFGVSLDQFKGWLKKLRKEGLKIILDLIPNHTSKKHPWFLKSQNKEDKYANYYIWANASSGLPNDWKNVNGDPAWTLDSARNTYYFHQFSPDYPDLNLTNEDVRTEIKEIMKFWLDAGVSGFHIEGVEYLVENQDLSLPNDDKSQTRNYVGTLSLLEELRKVADSYSDKPGREKLLFGTVEYANENQTLELWGSEIKRLHVVAPILRDLDATCGADCIKRKTDELLTSDENHWLGLQLGNQNTPRVASRMDYFGDYRDSKSRLIIAYTLQLFLPGTPFNYYGDEFGQRDGQNSTDGVNNYRTPMQWDNQVYAGFTTTNSTPPYIPVAEDFRTNNVQASLALFSKLTPLTVFKKLVKLRSKESFQWGKPKVCTPHNDLLLISRKATRFPYFVIAINTGTSAFHVSPTELECVPIKDGGKTLFHSQDKHLAETDGFKNGISLGPLDVVIFEFPADEE